MAWRARTPPDALSSKGRRKPDGSWANSYYIIPKPKVWTYNFYRASLYRDGKIFAIITPDGHNARSPDDAQLLLDDAQLLLDDAQLLLDDLNRPALGADLKDAINTAISTLAEQERSVPRTSVQMAAIRETNRILRKALTHL